MAETKVVPLRPSLSQAAIKGDDVELWLIRLPKEFDPELLVTKKLKLRENADVGTVIRTLEASADDGDGEGGKAARSKHELVAAEVSEFHDTRVLVESGKGAGVLRCGKPFSRAFEVRENTAPPASGADDEGSSSRVAVPVAHMVIPYTPVAQVTGLGVVFRPPGAGSEMPVFDRSSTTKKQLKKKSKAGKRAREEPPAAASAKKESVEEEAAEKGDKEKKKLKKKKKKSQDE